MSYKKVKLINVYERIFFSFFCLIIIINPLPLGSNRQWAWSFEALIATSLLVLMVTCSLFSSKSAFFHKLKNMKYELLLISLWFVVNILYLLPIPVGLLEIFSPNVASAYEKIGAQYGYFSLDVHASFQTLMLSVYYFLIFILGVTLINSRKRIKIMLLICLFLGVFESVYGMYLVSIKQTGLFVQATTVSVFNASGTFINKNHLVAFLSLSFILGLALRLVLSRKKHSVSQVDLKRKALAFVTNPLRMLDFSLFLILAGIWNTHSRSGLVSLMLSCLFLFFLLVYSNKIKSFSIKKITFTVSLIIVLLIFVADDVSYLTKSLGGNSDDSVQFVMASAEGRLLAVKQVLDNYHKYWLTGVGPGAYQVFFVNHRLLEQTAYFDHAHNDYIEFAIEYGVFSLVLLLLLMIFMYRIFMFVFKTTSSYYEILGACIITAMIYMLLHGNMDFNARIPANVVVIILAISMVYGKIVKLNVTKVSGK